MTEIGIFSSFELVSCHMCDCTSDSTDSVCVLARSTKPLTERGGGRVHTKMIDTAPDHTYWCSRPHIDIIDQLELSDGLPFKSILSSHRLNQTSVDTSEHCVGKQIRFIFHNLEKQFTNLFISPLRVLRNNLTYYFNYLNMFLLIITYCY